MPNSNSQIALLKEAFKNSIVIFDGAMGTELYRNHIFTNACFDELNVSRADLVVRIHESYLAAGAEVLTTHTTSANSFYLQKFGFADRVEQINDAAVQNARKAIADYREAHPKDAEKPIFIAGSVGPVMDTQKSLTFDQLVSIQTQQIQALMNAGADFIMFETLGSPEDLMAAEYAIQRLKETTGEDVPFILSFRPNMQQENPSAVPLVEILRDFQAACVLHKLPKPLAIGMNCGVGPEEMLAIVQEILPLVDLPMVVQPEAGVPRKVEVRSISMTSPEFFTEYAKRYIDLGVRGVGGCCGIGPEHILEMARSVKPLANARMHDVKEGELSEKATLLEPKPLAERSALGKKLAEKRWITSVELVPPRGFDLSATVAKCQKLKAMGVDCVNIPDGPRASCKISIITADRIQREAGIETILHFCCRDKNLIGSMADLLGAAACGIQNILFITGDPPKLGNYSFASGVFDTDSIGLVRLQKHLNRGIDLGGQPVKPPTEAVAGVGADPNALDFDREVSRTREKVAAGADYITTQPVFDPQALFRFMDAISDLNVPVLAGIWPLVSYRNAEFMRNEVPGVVVPDAIMKRMADAANDEQLATGVKIAQEAIEAVRSRVAGVQVSAPFGRVQVAFDVLQK